MIYFCTKVPFQNQVTMARIDEIYDGDEQIIMAWGYQVRVSLYSFMQSLKTRRHNTVGTVTL